MAQQVQTKHDVAEDALRGIRHILMSKNVLGWNDLAKHVSNGAAVYLQHLSLLVPVPLIKLMNNTQHDRSLYLLPSHKALSV